jgi:hypothetical protein
MRAWLLVTAILLLFQPPLPGRCGAPPQPLSLGTSLEANFRSRPAQTYAVDLAAGDYARVTAAMQGAAVRIIARSPSGEEFSASRASPTATGR